jgi:hypothetical protein
MAALTVYASEGGNRYHSTWKCAAFHAGSSLSDVECGEDLCRHDHPRMHPALDYPIAEVAESGRTPCRVCLPPLAVSEDFGHEPMDVEQFGNGRLHARFVACARCYPNSVNWPCLTAVLLALPTA